MRTRLSLLDLQARVVYYSEITSKMTTRIVLRVPKNRIRASEKTINISSFFILVTGHRIVLYWSFCSVSGESFISGSIFDSGQGMSEGVQDIGQD